MQLIQDTKRKQKVSFIVCSNDYRLTCLWQNVAWKDQRVSQSKVAAYSRHQKETKSVIVNQVAIVGISAFYLSCQIEIINFLQISGERLQDLWSSGLS